MGLPHAYPAEVIDLTADGDLNEKTRALVKTESMEVLRVVLPEGKELPEHAVEGEVSIQCLKGRVNVLTGSGSKEMKAGDWLFLAGSQRHALTAEEHSVLLVTILFNRAG